MTDSTPEIIEKIKSGNNDSFIDFVNEYKDKAYSLTLRILKNPLDAEDSLQESFLRLYKSIVENRFEQKSKLSTYFYSIVYNTAVDFYKKLNARTFNIVSIDVTEAVYNEGDEIFRNVNPEKLVINDELTQYSETPEKKYMKTEVENIIKSYLANIPEHYSVILNMFFINELSHDEISQILKLPEGTVKNRIFRAKNKLKELILKKYPVNEILMYV